jgi:antitoxin MazE
MKGELTKWGNSLAVRIPKPVAEEAQFREGDCLEVIATGPGHVEIRSREPVLTLADLVDQITAENSHEETSWGGVSGREAW